MAFLQDPRWGIVPGAPYGTNWWSGPGGTQFNISDLLRTMPPPPPPLTATRTPQDDAAAGALELRTDTGGGEGGNASGLDRGITMGGSIQNEPSAAQNATTYQADIAAGRYATPQGPWTTAGALPGSPATFNSRFGDVLGTTGMLAGTALGVPGIGLGLGVLGENIDMARYADALRAAGIAAHPDYLAASIAGAMPSLPGTNIGGWISNALGFPGARQQFENDLRSNLASIGPTRSNTTLGPAPMTDEERARLELALPGMPSVGFVENPVPEFDPATLGREYGYGAAPGSTQGVMGAPQGQTGYQSGTYVSGIEGGSGNSAAGYGGAPSVSGGASYAGGAAGNAPGGGDTGRDTGFFARGGLIGAPPGRYAYGGEVDAPDRSAYRPDGQLEALTPSGNYTTDTMINRINREYVPGLDLMTDEDWIALRNAIAPDQQRGTNRRIIERDINRRGYAAGGLIGAPPGRYAAGGAVRAASRMPGHYYPDVMMTPPRDYMSDADQRGAQGLAPTGQPGDRGELSPREQAIRDFMDDLSIVRQRDMFPDMLARGGAVGGLPPAAPGDNITPQQFGALRAINPPGPDDQIGALQTGEGVLTAKAVRAYPGLLEAANAGTLDPGRVKGLLTPAGMGRKPRLVR